MCSADREDCQTGEKETDERVKEARGYLSTKEGWREVQSIGERVRGEEGEKKGGKAGQGAYSQENKRFEEGLGSGGGD